MKSSSAILIIVVPAILMLAVIVVEILFHSSFYLESEDTIVNKVELLRNGSSLEIHQVYGDATNQNSIQVRLVSRDRTYTVAVFDRFTSVDTFKILDRNRLRLVISDDNGLRDTVFVAIPKAM
jgi:hypothetical protein